jgi:PASTA domain
VGGRLDGRELLWGMGRREVLTVVPDLVGLAVRAAQDVALDARLLAVDQAPKSLRTATGVVAAQDPPAGSYLQPGSRVRIWMKTDPDDGEGRDGRGGLRLPTGPITARRHEVSAVRLTCLTVTRAAPWTLGRATAG